MIKDASRLADMQSAWDAIVKLSQDGPWALIPGAGVVGFPKDDESWNLPFVLAVALLDDVLLELGRQGVFPLPSNRIMFLGTKVAKCAPPVLQWNDFVLVDELIERRNDLAHRAMLQPKKDCVRYIEEVGANLRLWGVIP